ncbi:MAG: hypothetical protein MUF22_08765, partial [Chitinispirillaceae bacterium]|nr:hypothetical protein [Chitinispirillaceae bacterium]
MEASPYQSGIFYFKNLAQAGEFPQQLRKTLASRIDPRFTAIFGSLLLFFSVTVAILSSLKVQEDTYNEKEVLKIQERYAQLVLNQPKPKVEPVEKVAKVKSQATVDQGKTEEKKEETAVNRDKESVVQREVRRESTRAEREQKREQVARQVMSSGIFAAITASSGGGSSGGPRVSDLLSADDGLSDISSMNISKGTFATKNESVDPATIGKRKSDRVSNVGIEKQDVGRAAV